MISAANRIFVRGRGIYAEVGGNLHVAGSARDPQVTSSFDLLRGSLALVGQRLVFTRGQVRFHGDVIPGLDLVAETTATDITARIVATSTRPSRPSRSLRSRACRRTKSCPVFSSSGLPGSLSGFQALELANAVATLRGNVDAFEGIRKTLGVDSLDISTSATWGVPRRHARDQRQDQHRRDDRSAAVGQRRQCRSRRDPPPPASDRCRCKRGIERAGVGAEWEYK